MDNTTEISHVLVNKKRGGGRSSTLTKITENIWEFCLWRELTLTAENLPGLLKQTADWKSRKVIETNSNNWKQKNIQSDQQTIESNQTGFVCRETECWSERLCQLEARPNSGDNRCIHDKMDGQASLCLPSILLNTEMSSQSRKRRGANNCNSIKADSSFLPNSTEHDSERSNSRQLLLSPEGKIHPILVNKTLKLVGHWN